MSDPKDGFILLKEGDKTVPTLEVVEEDENAREILRVWRHGDGSYSTAAAPYVLSGPTEWGHVLGLVAQGFFDNMPFDDEKEAVERRVALAQAFLQQLGIPIQLYVKPRKPHLGDLNRQPGVDPDPTKN